MFCPKCKKEYREDFTRCRDCDEQLVEALPGNGELVKVLETTDVTLLPIIKSLLEAADIPHVIQGENALGLLPVGVFGSDVGWRGLAASVLVPRNREEETLHLLEAGMEPRDEKE